MRRSGFAAEDPLAQLRRGALHVTRRTFAAAFVIGAIFTPPDIISQCMLAIPLWLLYELGVLVSSMLIRKRDQEVMPALP